MKRSFLEEMETPIFHWTWLQGADQVDSLGSKNGGHDSVLMLASGKLHSFGAGHEKRALLSSNGSFSAQSVSFIEIWANLLKEEKKWLDSSIAFLVRHPMEMDEIRISNLNISSLPSVGNWNLFVCFFVLGAAAADDATDPLK